MRTIMDEFAHVTLVSRRVSNPTLREAAGWRPRVPSARQGLAAAARDIAAH